MLLDANPELKTNNAMGHNTEKKQTCCSDLLVPDATKIACLCFKTNAQQGFCHRKLHLTCLFRTHPRPRRFV